MNIMNDKCPHCGESLKISRPYMSGRSYGGTWVPDYERDDDRSEYKYCPKCDWDSRKKDKK